MQIYNEKDQMQQKEMQNVQFEQKIITRKLNVGGVLCAERDKEKCNKESARLRGRPQQLICQLIKKKKTNVYYLFFKSNNIGKLMQM